MDHLRPCFSSACLRIQPYKKKAFTLSAGISLIAFGILFSIAKCERIASSLRRNISLSWAGVGLLVLVASKILFRSGKSNKISPEPLVGIENKNKPPSTDPLWELFLKNHVIAPSPHFIDKKDDLKLQEEFNFLNSRCKVNASEYAAFSKYKDRYLDIRPYEQNRVKMDEYINASCLPTGHILTQGPKGNTIEDFWQMVWFSEAQVIVMATNLTERGHQKCVQYWPESEIRLDSSLSITLVKSEKQDHYRLRIFHLKKENVERTVHQFHLEDWDDGSDFSLDSLHQAILAVEKLHTAKSPLIAHCSAGVGRSGTFIAC